MKEEWRDVPGYEGYYQASSKGRVRRKPGSITCPSGRVLTPTDNGTGYRRVTLSVQNEQTTEYVHRLVGAAFHGPCPNGKEVNHLNGDKSDNRPGNIQYVTREENLAHRADVLNRTNRGARHGNSKLTANDVRAIRRLDSEGVSHREIADRFGIHHGYVCLITKRRRWAWLD